MCPRNRQSAANSPFTSASVPTPNPPPSKSLEDECAGAMPPVDADQRIVERLVRSAFEHFVAEVWQRQRGVELAPEPSDADGRREAVDQRHATTAVKKRAFVSTVIRGVEWLAERSAHWPRVSANQRGARTVTPSMYSVFRDTSVAPLCSPPSPPEPPLPLPGDPGKDGRSTDAPKSAPRPESDR